MEFEELEINTEVQNEKIDIENLNYKETYLSNEKALSKFKNLKYYTVNNIQEFADAEKHIAKANYPSRSAEKNRTLRTKKKIKIDVVNWNNAWEAILFSFIRRLDKNINPFTVTKGQYIKYKSINSLSKIIELLDKREFAIKFIMQDSEYIWSFRFMKSAINRKRVVLKVIYSVKLPISVEFVSWRLLTGRISYIYDNKKELKQLKEFVESRWK